MGLRWPFDGDLDSRLRASIEHGQRAITAAPLAVGAILADVHDPRQRFVGPYLAIQTRVRTDHHFAARLAQENVDRLRLVVVIVLLPAGNVRPGVGATLAFHPALKRMKDGRKARRGFGQLWVWHVVEAAIRGTVHGSCGQGFFLPIIMLARPMPVSHQHPHRRWNRKVRVDFLPASTIHWRRH